MKILFIAPYPNEENSKDGMVQRVKHVDNIFSKYERGYLDVQHRKNFKGKTQIVDHLVKTYQLNSVVHMPAIHKILNTYDKIYVHSIAGLFYLLWILPFIDFKKIILDAHGIFPEELKFARSKKFIVFALIEKYVFSKLTRIICVTNAMRNHFIKKYPHTNSDNYFVYNILPSFNTEYISPEPLNSTDKINVIYSGNLQAWQNINLMLKVISSNDKPHIKYTILTGDVDGFKKELSRINLLHAEVLLASVKPQELPEYYSQAHYGFILRDDIDVNRVANPTKLIEYLSFGIIPIVKTPNIGDFMELGYEYISYLDFSEISQPKKSLNNQNIYKNLVKKMKNANLEGFVTNG
ncbi:glycosyltransferase family protein [Pedobacter agri]|uniref:Glycosyltransferase subfamily 4-like N-terminal domain-containing protein n=1 Tax=Pedobacter agri TaxID=454586 RepID=A0A9X3DAQ9_9SPHI|nr:group 1 glycosyl transferase [Pedobacter agri]MCX3264077.1 hypothetical protein [Pedobacter agri]